MSPGRFVLIHTSGADKVQRKSLADPTARGCKHEFGSFRNDDFRPKSKYGLHKAPISAFWDRTYHRGAQPSPMYGPRRQEKCAARTLTRFDAHAMFIAFRTTSTPLMSRIDDVEVAKHVGGQTRRTPNTPRLWRWPHRNLNQCAIGCGPYVSPPHKGFVVVFTSPFMRLVQHCMGLHAWYKQCPPGW